MLILCFVLLSWHLGAFRQMCYINIIFFLRVDVLAVGGIGVSVGKRFHHREHRVHRDLPGGLKDGCILLVMVTAYFLCENLCALCVLCGSLSIVVNSLNHPLPALPRFPPPAPATERRRSKAGQTTFLV